MFNPATPPQSVAHDPGRVHGRRLRHRRRLRGRRCCAAGATATTASASSSRSPSPPSSRRSRSAWATGRPTSSPSDQPVKLAAMEGLYETERPARRCTSAGVYVDGELRGTRSRSRTGCRCSPTTTPTRWCAGLDEVPPDQRPPVNVVHWSFQTMVGIGFALLRLGRLVRRSPGGGGGSCPGRAGSCAAPRRCRGRRAVVALEAGWITTEVGRQPWIVYGLHAHRGRRQPGPRPASACSASVVVYAVLTVATVLRPAPAGPATPMPVAPQEPDAARRRTA